MFLLHLFFKKSGVCSGCVPGVLWVCSGIKSRLNYYIHLKKNLGRVLGLCTGCVFRVCYFASFLLKKLGCVLGLFPGVLFLLHFFFEKIWGVFRVCCDCFIFFEKLWGVFWVCSVCSSVLFLLTRFSAHESRKALTQLYCVR